MNKPNIYLDNAASTRLDRRVREKMIETLEADRANPSSLHSPARDMRENLENHRAEIADLLGAQSREIIFTSGGTEANNLAVKGLAQSQEAEGNHVLISEVEHKSVLNPARQLAERGYDVTFLSPDSRGIMSPEKVEDHLRPETILVSVMLANNETGARQPVRDIARMTQERGVCLHTDAAQVFGKGEEDVDVDRLAVDAMTLSAHKVHGPKGIGILYVRTGYRPEPVQTGGDHEHGLRAGTENVAGITGASVAFQQARTNRNETSRHLSACRSELLDSIQNKLDHVEVNTPLDASIPSILNLSFPNVDGETMVLLLDREGLCASTGAACESDTPDPSHVIRAMNKSTETARAAVRFSLSWQNSNEEMKQAAEIIEKVYARARGYGS